MVVEEVEVGGVELDRILDMFRLIIFVGCWEVEVGWFFSLRERRWVRDLLVDFCVLFFVC